MEVREIDEAIVAFMASVSLSTRQETKLSARARLIATGVEGLDRMLFIRSFRGRRSYPQLPKELVGKLLIDAESEALGTLAESNPKEYVDRIEKSRVNLLILAILGDVDDPRAADILCKATKHRRWLYRSNAASSLGRRSDSRSMECLRRSLVDRHRVVRISATDAISRWERTRAIEFFNQMLVSSSLRPRNRERIEHYLQRWIEKGDDWQPWD